MKEYWTMMDSLFLEEVGYAKTRVCLADEVEEEMEKKDKKIAQLEKGEDQLLPYLRIALSTICRNINHNRVRDGAIGKCQLSLDG